MYTLNGVNKNAFAITGYTANALRNTGHGNLVLKMFTEAIAGDYNHLVHVCQRYIDVANKSISKVAE